MELKRNSDGTYIATYDNSKDDFVRLIKQLEDVAFAGVGNSGFVLEFQGLIHSFNSSRELFYFCRGMLTTLETPFYLKMEDHIKNIVSSVFKLDNIPFLSPDEFSDPE